MKQKNLSMMLILEIHVVVLQIEMNLSVVILTVLSAT